MTIPNDPAAPASKGRAKALPVMALVLASLSGCAGFQDPPQASCSSQPYSATRLYGQTLTELTYFAVDRMTQCLTPDVASGVSIVVSSLTDAQRLDQSTAFGNIVADFARSRLSQNHMLVTESRLRSAMLMKTNEGEMMLGREPSKLVTPPYYSAILTGTYAVGESVIFVDLKLIRADNAQILSAADFVVPRSNEIFALLNPPVGLAQK